MSKSYRPWNPNQQWLLPPSVHDWLPENDLVYFILDAVNELDISAITKKYEQEERGYPPYNPRMMVALLFYAYCRGIFSSRKIMAACEERLTFRVVVGDDIPNWRTISDFRKNNPDLVKEVFKHTVTFAKGEGMIDLSHLSTDGSKQKANAANRKVLTKEELEFLLRFVDDELEEWARQDDIEDEMFKEIEGRE